MMRKVNFLFLVSSALLLSACATTVKPTYVSPTHYQAFSCQQLQNEYNRIQDYIDRGVEPSKRTGVGVGIGIGGGWNGDDWGIGPAVSVNMGQSSDTKKTELARVLGEQEAIVQAAKFKNCPMLIKAKPQS